MKIKKILIANRGEIAVRIIRTCREMGIPTVAVFSQADRDAWHVHLADEAVCIGEAPSLKSYLKVPHILSACEITGADAIHPGYGFLAENSNFASICESCDVTFIGPSPTTIASLGDKAKAKAIAKKVKCPTIPGSEGVVADVKKGLKEAQKIGFPVLIKAVAGGGGRGIRPAHDADEFVRQFAAARTEAEASFNNPDVYIEKLIINPRHIEIQVIGDQHGNYAHLFERDCTTQRRRQKLIEECPSPILNEGLRKKICEAALAIVKEAKYHSVGTVEFLLDQDKNFYFMEVNTRIQVEHTITEELTGVDLVAEQIRIAQGEKLSFRQKDLIAQGHVIQFRINAEDPAHQFAPCPGLVEYYIPPGGRAVRIDTACFAGHRIPPHYDSLVAKLIVKGKNRAEAIARGKRALREFSIGGIKTTLPFHLFMLDDERFVKSDYSITYVDQLLAEGCKFIPEGTGHS